MKSVLLSVHPKWCELIAGGKKTVEVRKTRPKIETPFQCYIYATKPKTRSHPARITVGLKQETVVKKMKSYDSHFDVPMLSKFENGFCFPTPYHLNALSKIYNADPRELIVIDDTLLNF